MAFSWWTDGGPLWHANLVSWELSEDWSRGYKTVFMLNSNEHEI